MAEPTRPRWWRSPAAVAAWCIDRIISNWAAISGYIGSGALMSVLAWLQHLPPLAWGGAFFAGLILVAVVRFVNSAARLRRAMALYTEKQADTSSVNPLAHDFQNQQINLRDFYHPYGVPRSNLSFRNCDLFGPCELALGGSFSLREGCTFSECSIVVIKAIPAGAVQIRDVVFDRTRFFRITLLLTVQDARGVKALFKVGEPGMPVVSDGTYGEI
jgi:hypothetical protein